MLAARELNSASVLWSRNTDTNPPSIGASQPTKTYCSVDFVTRPAAAVAGINATRITAVARAA